MGKHYSDMYIINIQLENFIQNIKERNIEYITKISSKFIEYEDKFKIKIKKDIIIDYIKNKNPNIDFTEDLLSDINNRKFSLESFINYNIGSKIDVFLQSDNKTNNIINDNINDIKEEGGNFIVAVDNNNIDLNNIIQPQENINTDNDNYTNKNVNQLKLFSSKI